MLNILFKSSLEGSKLIIPSEENLKITYVGTPVYGKLSEILEFISDKGIVQRDPHGRFILLGETLPPEEVAQKRKSYEGKYKTITAILGNYPELKRRLEGILNRTPLRKRSINLIKEKATIRNLVERQLEREPYAVNIFIALPTYTSEIGEYRTFLKEISSKYPDAVFVIFDTPFGEEDLNNWINYKAKQEVAESHNLSEKTVFEENAKKVVEKYINELESGKIYFIFRGEEKSFYISRFDTEINEVITPKVFEKAPDILVKRNNEIRNENLWRESRATSLLDKVLNARSLEELRKSLSGVDKKLENLLWDEGGNWVVDLQLRIKEDTEHPIFYLYEEVKRIFESYKYCQPSHFEGLKRFPFGVYRNKIFYFLLALVFKNLADELYKEGYGKAQQFDLKNFLQGILEGKKVNLYLRLGSEEDKKLAKLLVEIFAEGLGIYDISDKDDFVKVRNQIRDYLKKSVGYPLWVLKYSSKTSYRLNEALEILSEFLITHEKDLTEDKKSKVLQVLENYTIDLKELINPFSIKEAWGEFIKTKLLGRDIDGKLFEKKLKEELNTDVNFWSEDITNRIADNLVSRLLKEAEERKQLEKKKKPEATETRIPTEEKSQEIVTLSEPTGEELEAVKPTGKEVKKVLGKKDSYIEPPKGGKIGTVSKEEREQKFSQRSVSTYAISVKGTTVDWKSVIDSLPIEELKRLIKELAEENKNFEERLIQWLRKEGYLAL